MPLTDPVAILGASDNPERYAHKALLRLRETGHTVIPVNPTLPAVEGLTCVQSLADIPKPVHTVTLYLGPARLEPLIPELIALRPQRVIANPGTESPKVEEACRQAGISYVEACTLVLLATHQFDKAGVKES
ncbi:MAG: CoA-binding protein [Planctomycetota bacterium]